jgi:hypothetical protein
MEVSEHCNVFGNFHKKWDLLHGVNDCHSLEGLLSGPLFVSKISMFRILQSRIGLLLNKDRNFVSLQG